MVEDLFLCLCGSRTADEAFSKCKMCVFFSSIVLNTDCQMDSNWNSIINNNFSQFNFYFSSFTIAKEMEQKNVCDREKLEKYLNPILCWMFLCNPNHLKSAIHIQVKLLLFLCGSKCKQRIQWKQSSSFVHRLFSVPFTNNKSCAIFGILFRQSEQTMAWKINTQKRRKKEKDYLLKMNDSIKMMSVQCRTKIVPNRIFWCIKL